MADSDFSVYARIQADTSNFEKGMKNAQTSAGTLTHTFQNLSKVVLNVAKMAGAAFAAINIVNFGKESVRASQSATKSLNILNNTIKVTGANAWTTTKEVAAMSNEIAKTTNYAVGDIQDMQSVLLGFKNITGETFKEANEAITDMATVMGMDLKSAAQTVGKALDDPIKGLDSLRRQGFAFTDEQKKQMKRLVESGNILKAQKMILDELSTTYGGSAKKAQTSFALMQYSITNLKETLGGKLQPVIDVVLRNAGSFVANLTNKIQNFNISPIVTLFEKIQEKVKSTLTQIKTGVKNAITWIRGVVTSEAFQPIIEVIDTIIGTLREEFEKIKGRILQILNVFATIKDKMQSGEGGGIVKTVAGVINKIIDVVWVLKEQIEEVTKSILGIIVNLLKNIWNGIKSLFESSNSALAESETDINSWGDYFYTIFNSVFRTVQDFIGMVKALLSGDWEVAWEYAKLAVMRIAEATLDTLSTIANAFPKLINGIVKGLNEVIKGANKLREALHLDPLELIGEVKNVDLSKTTGLEDAITNAENKIQKLTGKAADYTLKDLKGISSKSKGLTKHLLEPLNIFTASFIDDSEKRTAEVDEETKTIGLDFKGLFANLKAGSTKAFEGMKTGFSKVGKVFASVGSVILKTAQSIFSGIKNIMSKAFEFNISDSLDSLLEFEDSVLTFFAETLPNLPNYFRSAFESLNVLFENIEKTLNGDSVQKAISGFFDLNPAELIAKGVTVTTKFLSGVLKGIVETKQQIFSGLKTLFNSILGFVESFIKDVPNFIVEIVPGILAEIVNFINPLLSKVGPLVSAIVGMLPELANSILDNMVSFLKEGFPNLINGIINALPNIINLTGELASAIILKLPELITGIVEGLCKIIENLDETKIGEIVNAIVKMIESLASAIIKSAGTIITKLVPALFKLTLELIKKLPEIIIEVLKGIGNIFADVGKAIWNKIFGLDESGKSNLIESIKTTATTLGSGISGFVKGVGDTIGSVAGTVWSGVKTGAAAIGNGVKTAATWISGLFKHANGTNFAPRGLSLVGEAGPELINFRGGEQVLNNRNTQNAIKDLGSKQGNVFNVTFNNTQDTTAYAMMSQLRQYQRQMAFNGVL